jgi:hypothetical protein
MFSIVFRSTLEFVRKREKSKKETVQLMIEISEKRYQLEDWDGKLYGEALAKRHTLPPTYIQPILQQFAAASSHWAHRVCSHCCCSLAFVFFYKESVTVTFYIEVHDYSLFKLVFLRVVDSK